MGRNKPENVIDLKVIRDVLSKDDRVLFAYLYGSFGDSANYNDLDIAVYTKAGSDPFQVSSDLKVSLHEQTGITPDFYDIRIINDILEKGDLFSLIFLKRLFEKNDVLVDKDFDVRTDFLEKYSMKYRSCEGLLDEVLL